MAKSYYEKLKDPRWQKKRLEILERDKFMCLICESKEIQLHVHHGYYDKRDPWDYDNNTLWTLCKYCHEHYQESLRLVKELIGEFHPKNYHAISTTLAYLKNVIIDIEPIEEDFLMGNGHG